MNILEKYLLAFVFWKNIDCLPTGMNGIIYYTLPSGNVRNFGDHQGY